MSTPSTVVTFVADGRLRSIGVEHVAEAFRGVALTRVPRSAQAVAGAANLRGQVVVVLEAGRPAPAAARRDLLLLGDRRHALAVEAICGLATDAGSAAEPFDLASLMDQASARPRSATRTRRRAFAPRSVEDAPSHAFVGVVTGRQTYALPFDKVLAVVSASDGASRFAGRELAVIDLGRRLGLQSAEAKVVVVARTAAGAVGIAVDATTEVVRCRAEDIADAPDALNRDGDAVRFEALVRRGGRWLPVIDLDAVALAQDRPDEAVEGVCVRSAAPVSQVLAFNLDGAACGAAAADVAEIVTLGRLYRAPNLPPRLSGVISHRGAVIPVALAGRGPLAILIRHGGDSLALPIDAVSGLRPVSDRARDGERAGPWNAAERRATPGGEVLVFRPEWLMEAMRASAAVA